MRIVRACFLYCSSAVNRRVVGSSPSWGATRKTQVLPGFFFFYCVFNSDFHRISEKAMNFAQNLRKTSFMMCSNYINPGLSGRSGNYYIARSSLWNSCVLGTAYNDCGMCWLRDLSENAETWETHFKENSEGSGFGNCFYYYVFSMRTEKATVDFQKNPFGKFKF